jgi:hypothetical protein
MAERFMDEQGIASARELSMLSDEEVESAVKMHNQSIPTSRVRELKLGIGHVKKIKALKYHAAVLRMQGKEFVSDYFVELCGVKGTFTRAVGLAPFARDDSRKDDVDLTEIEREVFSIRLEGPEYDRGNPIFFPKQGQGYLSRGDHCAVCFCSGREECVPGSQGSPEWGRSSPQEDCGCQACY